MNNNIMVSICCLVYNHEKYLRQCLDSLLMQKTDFIYEILIHDDASTDGSTDIIREYEEKYPDIIKPIYQTENQYSKGVLISWTYQFPRAKGKYLAICEGDDYWVDSEKLQVQFDYMEENLNCSFCTHVVQHVTESGETLNVFSPRDRMDSQVIPKDVITRNLLSSKPYMFQTSSFFVRKSIMEIYYGNLPKFFKVSKVGDAPLKLFFAAKGDYYFISRIMSCYRVNSIGSWSSSINDNNKKKEELIHATILSLKSFDEFTNYKYSLEIHEKCIEKEFELLLIQKDYKAMLCKKYKACFKTLSVRAQLHIFIVGHFPKTEILFQSIKGRK